MCSEKLLAVLMTVPCLTLGADDGATSREVFTSNLFSSNTITLMSSYLTGAQNEENMQTTTEVTCVDTTPNCSTYGPQRCLSHTWANVECKKYCGICNESITSSSQTTRDELCINQIDNCASYGRGACIRQYEDWGKKNCKEYCGFCSNVTVNAVCENKARKCKILGSDTCLAPYDKWASRNCRRFCGLCTLSEEITTKPEICGDAIYDCERYGHVGCLPPYQGWAYKNCRFYCGLCRNETLYGTCRDRDTRCDDLANATCSPPYDKWASTNCRLSCGLCNKTRIDLLGTTVIAETTITESWWRLIENRSARTHTANITLQLAVFIILFPRCTHMFY